MIASESVPLPEPFGPMLACTEPLWTTRSIPFRIVLPSTLTTRSLISRLDIHTLTRRGLRDLRESHAVEGLRDAVLELEPYGPRSAVRFAYAVQDRLALSGTDLRLDRPLERAHDVARRDFARLPREDITATRAALAVHETSLAKRGDELLEVRLGQVLALRDGVQRNGPLAPVPCEIDHETHPVFTSCGDVKGCGRISDHFTRNCTRSIPRRKPLESASIRVRSCPLPFEPRPSDRHTRRRSSRCAASSLSSRPTAPWLRSTSQAASASCRSARRICARALVRSRL